MARKDSSEDRMAVYRSFKLTKKVLPCPCCGSTKLDVGIIAGENYGIRCIDIEALAEDKKEFGCGLRLTRSMYDAPKKIRTIRGAVQWAMDTAIDAWNQRCNLSQKEKR